VDDKIDTRGVNLAIDIEHVNHAVPVDIGKIEHVFDHIGDLIARHKRERAQPCQLINVLVLLRRSLTT